MAKKQGINRGEFTTIWISKATKRRLRMAAEQLVRAAERGTVKGIPVSSEQINPAACGLSMDALLNLLLDQRDAHQKRAREQQEARRKRPPQVEGEV